MRRAVEREAFERELPYDDPLLKELTRRRTGYGPGDETGHSGPDPVERVALVLDEGGWIEQRHIERMWSLTARVPSSLGSRSLLTKEREGGDRSIRECRGDHDDDEGCALQSGGKSVKQMMLAGREMRRNGAVEGSSQAMQRQSVVLRQQDAG